GDALYRMTGWRASLTYYNNASIAAMQAALARGDMLVAGSFPQYMIDATSNVVGSHAYTIVSVAADGTVRLYNPWGVDGYKSVDGKNDGYVTVSWTAFKKNYFGYWTA